MLKGKYLDYIGIVLVCFLLYGNTLNNNYALDDNIVITHNEIVKKGILGIPEIFTKHSITNTEQSYGYRPIPLTTFAIEYSLFKEKPGISHFINLLIYIFTGIILIKLLRRLLGDKHQRIIYLSVFIFLIHPIHSEVVNNIKSRDELLAFLFSLLSLLHFVRLIDSKKYIHLFLGCLFLFLALLSKPTAVVFLAITPISIVLFRNLKFKQTTSSLLFILASFAVFYLIKNYLITTNHIREFEFHENPLFFSPFSDRIPAAGYISWFYLKMLFIPNPLLCYYGFDAVKIASWNDVFVYIGITIHLILFFIAIRNYKRNPIVSFGILIYLIGLFPYLNFVSPAVGIVAERFIYVASLGFSITIAIFINQTIIKFGLEKKKIIVGSTIVLIGLPSIIYVNQRNQDWESFEVLYKADVSKSENSYHLNMMYANRMIELLGKEKNQQKLDSYVHEAKKHFIQAIKIYPDNPKPYVNLSTLYMGYFRDYKKGEEILLKAIKKAPHYYKAHINLAKGYHMLNDREKVDYYFEEALKVSNHNLYTYVEVIEYMTKGNRFEDAEFYLNQALIKFSGDKELYKLCADLYLKQGMNSEARVCLERYLSINPNDSEIRELYRKINQ
jgi:protein O-mannosyl-transferase